MSGALSGLARGLGALNGAARGANRLLGALSGAVPFGGAGGPVTLGDFAFDGFEVPESIRLGGEMGHTKHRFPGGAFSLDLMGGDDHDLEWSGKILGQDAAARAQQLDRMWRAGEVLDLTWASFSYSVVVRIVEIEYRSPYEADYSITCLVAPPPEGGKVQDSDALDGLLGDGALDGIRDTVADVRAAVADVAERVAPALNMARGAVQAVSGVVTPLTSTLGVRVPYLTELDCVMSLAGQTVGTLGALGAAGAGGVYSPRNPGFDALDAAARLNASGLSAANQSIEAAADASGDEPVSAPAAAKAAGGARDAALGSRAKGAIGTARRAVSGASAPRVPTVSIGGGNPIADATGAARSAGVPEGKIQVSFSAGARPDLYRAP